MENLPVYHGLSSGTKHLLEKLVSEYNMRLVETMDHFKADKPGMNASFFNTNELFRQLFDHQQVERNALSHCNKQSDCGE